MSEIIAEIIKIGSSKIFNIFTPAVVEGLVVDEDGNPIPGIIVYIGNKLEKTKMSGKFIIEIKRGIYNIDVEYNGKKYDHIDGIHVGGGEKVSTVIKIKNSILEEVSDIKKEISTELSTMGVKEELVNSNFLENDSLNSEEKEIYDKKQNIGPTRFAKNYIENQPQETKNIIYTILEGLSSSITYHARESNKYLEVRQSEKPGWEIYIIGRPRKKTVEIYFNASSCETLSGLDEGQTYVEKLTELNLPNSKPKNPEWNGYINCELSRYSDENEIESARFCINWFLMESYKSYSA